MNNMDVDCCMKKGLSSCQLQLSNSFRRLWTEHVMWTRSFIISTAFNLPDLDAVTARLLRNPEDFADVLKCYYSKSVADKFQELLTEHLLIAAAFVNAAKAGDTQKALEERAKWYANAEDISRYLDSINPFWCEATWHGLLDDHLNMTEAEASQILTGKYESSIAEFQMIQVEALKMADYMTCGIIRQFRLR